MLLSIFQETLTGGLDRRADYYRQQARHVGHPKPVPQPLMTIPNLLTFFRLLLVPVMLLMWESTWKFSSLASAVIFIVAAITDWADGYIARKVGRWCSSKVSGSGGGDVGGANAAVAVAAVAAAAAVILPSCGCGGSSSCSRSSAVPISITTTGICHTIGTMLPPPAPASGHHHHHCVNGRATAAITLPLIPRPPAVSPKRLCDDDDDDDLPQSLPPSLHSNNYNYNYKMQIPPSLPSQYQIATVFGAFLDPVADKVM